MSVAMSLSNGVAFARYFSCSSKLTTRVCSFCSARNATRLTGFLTARSDLQRDMYRYTDACFFLDVTGLCRAGSALHELIQVATHVVFYGHGERDLWSALPGTPPTALVEVNTVSMLDKRNVYAACCWSLTGLGKSFGQNCSGNFIGYDNQFGFESENESEFKHIVNQSVINFVTSGNAKQTVSDLRQEWAFLSTAFASGHLRLRPNAIMAGHIANFNSQRVGSRP